MNGNAEALATRCKPLFPLKNKKTRVDFDRRASTVLEKSLWADENKIM